MKTIFGTVFYMKAYAFLPFFIDSLNRQTNNDFSVLIINDDIDDELVKNLLLDSNFDYEIVCFSDYFTPAGLRINLLKEALKRNVDLLILGDADDLFSEDRVEKIVKYCSSEPSSLFFYNDIYTFNNLRIFPPLPSKISLIDEICDYNFLGISNTAIRINQLSFAFLNSLFEGDQDVFDWYLYSRLLIAGYKGSYVNGPITYYRFHENNILGDQDSNDFKIQKEIEVKKTHYYSLANRSMLMRDLFYLYNSNRFRVLKLSSPHYWWEYTIGGK